MKKAAYASNAKDRATTRTLLPLVAIGGGLAATPAAALELGELTVESRLGQPLRASIAYALAPNEMLSNTCVSVSGRPSTSGLPGIGNSALRITERAIVITGSSAIREPMMATRVTIDCPYTPNLSREYMLLVDPAEAATTATVSETPVANPAPVAATPVVAPRAQQARTVDTSPIGPSSRYQVQPGESLSEIVARIENRAMTLWPAVNAIYTANPDAFIDNDPNKLKAGAWLTIPSLNGTAPVVNAAVVTPASTAPAANMEMAEPAPVVDTPVAETSAAAYEPAIVESAAEPVAETAADVIPVTDSTADLQPGDVIVDATSPFVQPADSPTGTVVIPDTELEGPQTTSTSPNVPTATVSTPESTESSSLLTWLIGGGLAMFIALLFFGRRMRGDYDSSPLEQAPTHPARRASDRTEELEAVAHEDYDLEDDSPTEENLALDADLILGTGLEEGTEMEVAEDFGFAAPTAIDIELPFEPEPAVDASTDIIPPVRTEIDSILESEVLPEDDDYELSVIVDATKMPQVDDVTERDLKAIEVDAGDETLIADNYTISKEVDYDILEQDYEEELTATQALNVEIARATAELVGDIDGDDVGDDEVTSEMPLATVTELDVTASMAQPDEDTVEVEQSRDPGETGAVTISMSADEKTAEMPVAGNDDTVEMDVEGGKVDTKAL